MRLLWQRGPAPVKDLATALQLDCGTLSPLLNRLEAAGLIQRTRRPDDERSVEIALTAAGQAMRGDAADVPARSSPPADWTTACTGTYSRLSGGSPHRSTAPQRPRAISLDSR